MAASWTVRRLIGLLALGLIGLASPGFSEGTPPPESPVHGKIVFARNFQIWTVNADGSGELQLTKGFAGGGHDYNPAWSADGTRIAFSREFGGAPHQIFAINADGSGVTQLTTGQFGGSHPAWSPDGEQIAFISANEEVMNTLGGCGCYAIELMDADGSNRRVLEEEADADDISWSPDGSRLAFTSRRDGDVEIYIVGVDGSDAKQLTKNLGWVSSADWSPDGSKVVFDSGNGMDNKIHVINSDGTGPRALKSEACSGGARSTCLLAGRGPAWSADGTQIAFSEIAQGPRGGYNIYAVNADGTNKRAVTNNGEGSEYRLDIDPDWQPAPLDASPTIPPASTEMAELCPATSSTLPPSASPGNTEVPSTPHLTPSPAATELPNDSPTVTPLSPTPSAADTGSVTPTQPPPASIVAPDAGTVDIDNAAPPELVTAEPVPLPTEGAPQPAAESQVASTAAYQIDCQEAGSSSLGQTAQAVGLIALGVLAVGSLVALPAAALWRRRR